MMGGSLGATEIRYSSWADAAANVRFPLREPRWLPESYWLSALQSFLPDIGAGKDRRVDSVIATYTGSGRDHIVFDQFWVERPSEFDIASTLANVPRGIGHGVVQVGTQPGFWHAGIPTREQPDSPPVWDEGMTILTWADGQVGYRVEGKNATLATLLRVAVEST